MRRGVDSHNAQRGFSVVEVLLATTVFALLVTALVGALIYGQESTAVAGQRARAVALAEEGLEATRNIRDNGFNSLTDGTHGLEIFGNVWNFSGTSDVSDIFTRSTTVATIDADTKSISSTVSWQATPSRAASVTAETYLTNWQGSVGGGGGIGPTNGGMLAYADTTVNGGDGVVYKILDTSSAWGTPANVPDIGVPSDRPAVGVKLYASATRNEKILVTKHYANGAGADQYLYAQVWDGSSWGNLVSLSSWNGGADSSSRDYDGAFLNNGDFLLVYEDNTNTPQYRTWDGSAWSSAAATVNVGANPTWIDVAGRPGTDEVMMTTFDTGNDTNTALYDGSSWGGLTEHANPGNPGFDDYDLARFVWSPNDTTRGAVIYNEANDSDPNIRIFDRTGGAFGSWGSTVENVNVGGNVQASTLYAKPDALEYLACFEDSTTDINCLESDTTPTWSSLTNGEITTDTGPGIERSFDVAYEKQSGNLALAVYSSGTGVPREIPKYRTFDPSTNSFSSESQLNTLTTLLEAVRLKADPNSDDMLVVMADTAQTVYTAVWDGDGDAFFGGQDSHGTNGTADSDLWFDFAWNE